MKRTILDSIHIDEDNAVTPPGVPLPSNSDTHFAPEKRVSDLNREEREGKNIVELKRVANGSGSELATVNDRAIRPIPVGRSSTTLWSAPGSRIEKIFSGCAVNQGLARRLG